MFEIITKEFLSAVVVFPVAVVGEVCAVLVVEALRRWWQQ